MSSFRTSDGTILYYEDVGEGEPILFIHGWYADHRYFKDTIDIMKNNYRCICFDLRGHGYSETPFAGRTIDRLSLDIKELIEFLKLKDVTLVGHSMGGLAIYGYIDAYGTKNIKNMCVMDMSPFPVVDMDFHTGAKAIGVPINGTYTKLLESTVHNWQLIKPAIPFILIPWAMMESFVPRQLTGPNPSSVVASFWCAMLDVNYSKSISSIDIPFTYVTADTPIYGENAISFLKENVKSEFKVYKIKNANHITMGFESEQIVPILCELMGQKSKKENINHKGLAQPACSIV